MSAFVIRFRMVMIGGRIISLFLWPELTRLNRVLCQLGAGLLCLSELMRGAPQRGEENQQSESNGDGGELHLSQRFHKKTGK